MIDRTLLDALYVRRAELEAKGQGLVSQVLSKLGTLTRQRRLPPAADSRTRRQLAEAELDYAAARNALSDIDQELGELGDDIEHRELALKVAAAPRVKAEFLAEAEAFARALDAASASFERLNAMGRDIRATFGTTSVSGHITLGLLGTEPLLAIIETMRSTFNQNREASPISKFRSAMKACGCL